MTPDPISEVLGHRPGKVIAVHLSYRSRAAQRGRTPAHPSYFLKTASSLTGPGQVERPAGTELLGFEGEVAVVIASPARRVSPQEAWRHVGWVTAANDLGLHDLRYADKGSNVRSKGGDGYTPVGPGLLEAGTLDPARLAVRTWLDDELVQDDTTEGLLFPFALMIADLSRVMTLERGDVILTGTPAGASVARPGQRIAVEVSSLDDPSRATGRLVTTVTDGPALAEVGSPPKVDDAQRADAWGQSAPAPAPGQPGGSAQPAPARPGASTESPFVLTPELRERLAAVAVATLSAQPASGQPGASAQPASGQPGEPVPAQPGEPAPAEPGEPGASPFVLTPELRERLAAVAVATLSVQLRRRGYDTVSIDGVRPLVPGRGMVGTARTLRYVPYRKDLFAAHGAGFNAQKQAIDSVDEGEVLVMEARGDSSAGTLGDILALRAKVRGAAGIITDGAVRDATPVAEVAIPVHSSGAHPAVLGRRHVPWERDVTISCGGATVQPGDVVVADDDGALVIPPALVAEVLEDAEAQEAEEAFIAEMVVRGESVDGLYPMNDQWREAFARWQTERRGAGRPTPRGQL